MMHNNISSCDVVVSTQHHITFITILEELRVDHRKNTPVMTPVFGISEWIDESVLSIVGTSVSLDDTKAEHSP